MLPLIYEESLALGLSSSNFADLNALDMLIPGSISINSATYVGYLVSGFKGATLASLAVSIPSFIFVLAFLRLEARKGEGNVLKKILDGIKSS